MCIEQYIVVLIFLQILFNDLASLSVYNLHFHFQRSTFCLFCVVIRVFSSPPQRPMTSVFKRLLYQILHITCCPILNFIYFTTITKQFIQACSLEPMFEFGRSSCGRKPEYRTRVAAVRGEYVNTAPARQPQIAIPFSNSNAQLFVGVLFNQMPLICFIKNVRKCCIYGCCSLRRLHVYFIKQHFGIFSARFI